MLSAELNGEFDSEKREAHKPHSSAQSRPIKEAEIRRTVFYFILLRSLKLELVRKAHRQCTGAGAPSITQCSSVACRRYGRYYSVICRSGGASRRRSTAQPEWFGQNG